MVLTACTQRLQRRIITRIFTLNLVGGRTRLMQQDKGQIKARHETIFFGPMLERLVYREPQAVRKFITSFTPAVHSIIREIIGSVPKISQQELEEYTQDCFLKIFQKLSTFDESKGNRLETWAYTVAKNLMRDAGRRRQSHHIGSEISLDERIERSGETESGPESSQPEMMALARQDHTLLEQTLQEMAEAYPQYRRDCLILLVELECHRNNIKPTVQVIALRLGCDSSTVSRIKQRWTKNGFLDALKSHLKQTGVLP